MAGEAYDPYEPLNVPKPFGDSLWIVDGPEIRMDYGPFKIPFPTRMTIVRLADGGLWIHSPIAPDPGLLEAVRQLGPVHYLIAPNTIHFWFMADWLALFPEAKSFAVADLAEQTKKPFRIDTALVDGAKAEWSGEIDWLLVPGTLVSEAVFFVKHSRTVILTDLIENFEPARVRNPALRWLMKISGAAHPDGKAPIDLRSTFRPKMAQVRKQLRQVADWQPERVVMAHGLPYATGGEAELRRAFRWAI